MAKPTNDDRQPEPSEVESIVELIVTPELRRQMAEKRAKRELVFHSKQVGVVDLGEIDENDAPEE